MSDVLVAREPVIDELDRPLDYLPVETDAAQRAAEFINELV